MATFSVTPNFGFTSGKTISYNTKTGFNIQNNTSGGKVITVHKVRTYDPNRDPRVKLRNQLNNKIVVPPGFGGTAKRPVPSTRGGGLASTTLSYAELKQSLLQSGALFEDPEFPATDSSLYYSQRPSRRIEWLRPGAICQNPQFISGGASRFDVRQGELGDCWLLAAVACLSMNKELFENVVPVEQNFNSPYCGLFHFRFWHCGEWKEVVVDDRLPAYNGRLIYMHSTEKNEFWSALLEKAYAKLYGSYEALKGGSTTEALVDFTGGLGEMFELGQKTPSDMMKIMLKAQQRNSFMACSIQADPNVVEAQLPNGLIRGHAYSITSVKLLDIPMSGSSGKIPLVRIRNPWGNEAEWKGAWSDGSREWSMIPNDVRQQVGLTFDDDGEFWMSYTDFINNFEKLEVCHLGPQSYSVEADGCRKWEMCLEHGSWLPRVSAGGCRNYLETFWTNPQFCVTVVDPDEDDDDNTGTLIVGLMQKGRRKLRKSGMDTLTIGYAIYELSDDVSGTLGMDFFKYHASKARSPAFINLREVSGRHKLPPGKYVIIPSTFEPNKEGEFLLRMFSENPQTSSELDENIGEVPSKDAGGPGTNIWVPPVKLSEEQVDALRRAYVKVAGVDGEIDCEELRDILNAAFTQGKDAQNFRFDGFTLESCRSLVAMMDFDRSGMLNFDEFKTLWERLREWKTAFKSFDADQSGVMNSFELRNALKGVGFSISNAIFATLVMRFSRRDGRILFDDFIMCCARLKTVFDIYKTTDKDGDGQAMFAEDMFIDSCLYL